MHESTCFEHIDPDAIEAANNETEENEDEATPALRPWPMTVGKVEDVAKNDDSDEGPRCPKCGKQYGAGTNGPAYLAKHVAGCKGVQARSGRIAARAGSSSSTTSEAAKREPRRRTPPAAKRSSVQRKKTKVSPKKRTPTAFGDDVLKALKARAHARADELDLLNKAIDALEALA